MNENFVMKRDPYLEFSYMKKAAEAGLTEAQHNLGVLYLQGAHSDPNSKTPIVNESKALTW